MVMIFSDMSSSPLSVHTSARADSENLSSHVCFACHTKCLAVQARDFASYACGWKIREMRWYKTSTSHCVVNDVIFKEPGFNFNLIILYSKYVIRNFYCNKTIMYFEVGLTWKVWWVLKSFIIIILLVLSLFFWRFCHLSLCNSCWRSCVSVSLSLCVRRWHLSYWCLSVCCVSFVTLH